MREQRRAYITQVSKFTAGCGDRWRSEALKIERQEDEGSRGWGENGRQRESEKAKLKAKNDCEFWFSDKFIVITFG